MEIYNRCSLCFEGGTEDFYNKMINYDSLVLCPNCYKKYTENEYNKKAMLCNSIRMYRGILEDIKTDLEFYKEIAMKGGQ